MGRGVRRGAPARLRARLPSAAPDRRWQRVSWGDEGCLETVYSDQALTTQLDEHGIPTSSSSEPSLMLAMLEALDADAGDQVFELGTGTGCNACLLAHHVGAPHVTSMDVDPQLVEDAAHRCRQAGYSPHLCTGDASQGFDRRGPYTKTMATFGLRGVPTAVLDQAAEGAVLVLPIGFGVARLTSNQPGHAQGRFLSRPAYFMARRTGGARPRFADLEGQALEQTGAAPADVLDRLRFPLSLALPGHQSCSWRDDEGNVTAVGPWTEDGSTAMAYTSGAVRQIGPRRLWSAVEDLTRAFPQGTPVREDFGITATPTCQRAWFGDPSGPGWEL